MALRAKAKEPWWDEETSPNPKNETSSVGAGYLDNVRAVVTRAEDQLSKLASSSRSFSRKAAEDLV